ncbi:MAG: winged helix-turn-helix transcriptional regulator [Gemmatimonadaceae bacterium]|nr:winged helix-turn-helix transcriptional regulator [Gemmatimonadaceae bacterium]
MDLVLAIADPIRRDILMLLRERVMSAGDLADCFDVSRPAVSRHLRVLRESGLVVDEVRGRKRLYHLDTAPLAPLMEWLTALHVRWSGNLDALETEVYRTRRERRSSPSLLEKKRA